MRPGGPRRRYRGALSLWLTLATTVPATAQVTPLTTQNVFNYRPSNAYANYLVAVGGLFYTDNVQRTSQGAGGTVLLLGLSGHASRDGTRLDYRLSSNLALPKYQDGAFPTEPTGFLDGKAELKIVPSFFSWIARDTYSQVQINLYAPVTPANLVGLNLITTGPRVTMRPTLRTSVTLDALYSYVTSSSAAPQYANIDSHRYGGDLKIDRAFSESASLYVDGRYEKTEFKDQVNNNNFSIGDAVAGYHLRDGRTVFDFSGGYSQLRLYDVLSTVAGPGGTRETLTTEEFNEPIWNVDLSRLITASQRVALHASEQFADAASSFRLGFDQPVPTVAPGGLAISSPFKLRQYVLNWHFQGMRTSVEVELLERQSRYLLSSGNDFDSRGVDARLNRLLSPVLTWELRLSYQHHQQTGAPSAANGGPPAATGESAKVYGALTDLRWQVGERLGLRLVYVHTRQNSAYSDNQIGVTAEWALVGAHAGIVQPNPGLSPISPASTRSP
jgi:hypothetical protein